MKNTLCHGTPCPPSASLATVEAHNALRAERFRALPDDIPLWRFREVLTQLGASLGLSGGAVVYALDLMGMLTEADWRGDGRAVTYHSLRSYARKVGRSERTICAWERQLIAAGLAHRSVKHARRHGGAGNDARRTGLDWRSFGVLLPDLLVQLERRRAMESRRLDLEARIRSERRIVLGLAEGLEEGRAAHIRETLAEWGVLRLRSGEELLELERRLAALTLLRTDLAAEIIPAPADLGDNQPVHAQISGQSEEIHGRIDSTKDSSCPTDIRIKAEKLKERAGKADPSLPLERLWQSAPMAWKRALGEGVPITWPVLVDVANHMVPELEVSAYAWQRAVQQMGMSDAATALLILDRNRSHPKTPVRSVGGALMGMVRRAETGTLDLTPSVYGILARWEGQGGQAGPS